MPGYYLNFDDDRLINFEVKDFQNLYESFHELYNEKTNFYFDEIQNVIAWERFVRRLHNQEEKVFVTGSNASMLSKELGTHLTGRYLQINLFPFSFKEYIKLKKFNISEQSFYLTKERAKIKRCFKEYLFEGGLPEYLNTKNKDYLGLLYDNILYKDIIVRYNLNSEKPIKELVYLAMNSISKEISFNSLKNLIGVKNSTTVKDYFSYLENSYLIFLIPKFDYSLKKQIFSNKKVYCIDNALAVNLGFRISNDFGRLLENLVFIELKRRGEEIFYFQEKGECDFVLKKGVRIYQAIQVCYEFNKTNRDREVNGLFEAMKKFKLKNGLILTLDSEEEIIINRKKVIVKPVWNWLLEK